MTLNLFPLLVFCNVGLGFVRSGVDAQGTCIEEPELISALDQFNEEKSAYEYRILDKVLSGFGENMSLAFGSNVEDPVNTFLLQYVLEMHIEMRKIISGIRELVHPMDCSDILEKGEVRSGEYDIFPFRYRWNKPIKVHCDMDTDGGGWTVFLLRTKEGRLNFTSTWTQYREFFGNASQEYWIGTDTLHVLTSNRKYAARFDATAVDGGQNWGKWKSFSVDNERNNFSLSVERLEDRSAAGNDQGFALNNGQEFSTMDKDNGKLGEGKCDQDLVGGWWYNGCSSINPTGLQGVANPKGISVGRWSSEDDTFPIVANLAFKIRPQR